MYIMRIGFSIALLIFAYVQWTTPETAFSPSTRLVHPNDALGNVYGAIALIAALLNAIPLAEARFTHLLSAESKQRREVVTEVLQLVCAVIGGFVIGTFALISGIGTWLSGGPPLFSIGMAIIGYSYALGSIRESCIRQG